MIFNRGNLEQIYTYIIGKQKGELSKVDAIDLATRKTGLNTGSIGIQFDVFENMISGKSYGRSISIDNTDIFLKHIYEEFGATILEHALTATKGHLVNRGSWGRNNGHERVVRKYAKQYEIEI